MMSHALLLSGALLSHFVAIFNRVPHNVMMLSSRMVSTHGNSILRPLHLECLHGVSWAYFTVFQQLRRVSLGEWATLRALLAFPSTATTVPTNFPVLQDVVELTEPTWILLYRFCSALMLFSTVEHSNPTRCSRLFAILLDSVSHGRLWWYLSEYTTLLLSVGVAWKAGWMF